MTSNSKWSEDKGIVKNHLKSEKIRKIQRKMTIFKIKAFIHK